MNPDHIGHPAAKRSAPGSGAPALTFPCDHQRHPGVAAEWWYLYAFLDDRHTLVACFWSHHEPSGATDGLVGAYALTEIAGARRWQGTFVDRPTFELSRERVRRLLRGRPDPALEATLEVTDAGQVFAPYRLAEEAHCLSSEARPIDVRVGPCRLVHDARARALRLHIEDRGLRVDLACDLSTSAFPMGGTGTFGVEGLRMAGYTHPQATATGTLAIGGDARRVRGKAWCDHQWGDWEFESSGEHYFHPEWDYFAILLDDGRSLNVWRWYRAGPNGRQLVPAIGMHPVLCEPDGAVRTLGRAVITARDRIESGRTNNLYEYGWTIELPDLEGTLELEPFHEDHELFVFIPRRGILELGCRVTGRLHGRHCQGAGFVESFGEAPDINSFFWGRRKANLARQLERFMPQRFDPAWLARICGADAPLAVDADALERGVIRPIWAIMSRTGKGWRSTWATTCCHALEQDQLDGRFRDLLPLTEMLHTGSLVIDDIEDGSPVRRGGPALHTEIGTDLAINVGNFLYFLPLIIIQEADWLSASQRAAVYDVIASTFRQGHIGQAMDLMWSRDRYDLVAKVEAFAQTRAQLLEQYGLKTGCQLEAAARIAGIITGAPSALVAAVAAYSRVFGIAFQIADDCIDLQGDHEPLGKPAGEDARNGKLNMVLLYVLAAARDAERAALIHALQAGRGDEGFRRIRELARHTGALERCLDDAEAMMDRAWRRLDALPASDAKIIMRSAPKWLLRQRRAVQQAFRQGAAPADPAPTAPVRTPG